MTEYEGSAERYLREEREKEWAGLGDLLQPNEKLLCRTDFYHAPGKYRLEKPPDTRSAGRKFAEGLASVILYPLWGSPPSVVEMMGGVSISGKIGSCAYRLHKADFGTFGKNRTDYFLVTDRRLLLVSRKSWGKDRDWAMELEIPRDALAQGELDSRPFTRGRVALTFTDGSMIALKFGSWRTGTARALVQALTSPGTVEPIPL